MGGFTRYREIDATFWYFQFTILRRHVIIIIVGLGPASLASCLRTQTNVVGQTVSQETYSQETYSQETLSQEDFPRYVEVDLQEER